jgi:hypothetical protein
MRKGDDSNSAAIRAIDECEWKAPQRKSPVQSVEWRANQGQIAQQRRHAHSFDQEIPTKPVSSRFVESNRRRKLEPSRRVE